MKSKRIIADIIDLFIMNKLADLFFGIIDIIFNRFIDINFGLFIFILCMMIGFIILILFFTMKDIIMKNRSIGKCIMGLHLYDENNKIIENKELLIYRNLLNIKHYFQFVLSLCTILITNKTYSDNELNISIK